MRFQLLIVCAPLTCTYTISQTCAFNCWLSVLHLLAHIPSPRLGPSTADCLCSTYLHIYHLVALETPKEKRERRLEKNVEGWDSEYLVSGRYGVCGLLCVACWSHDLFPGIHKNVSYTIMKSYNCFTCTQSCLSVCQCPVGGGDCWWFSRDDLEGGYRMTAIKDWIISTALPLANNFILH